MLVTKSGWELVVVMVVAAAVDAVESDIAEQAVVMVGWAVEPRNGWLSDVESIPRIMRSWIALNNETEYNNKVLQIGFNNRMF